MELKELRQINKEGKKYFIRLVFCNVQNIILYTPQLIPAANRSPPGKK